MTTGTSLPEWLTMANAVAVGAAATVGGGLWWMRKRDLARQRSETRELQALTEEMFTARSPEDLHSSLVNTLQHLFEVGAVSIYAHNRAGNSLHAVAPAGVQPGVVPLDSTKPTEGLRLAFQQRESLLVEDPHVFPCPVLWLPMTAEGETKGVMECRFAAFGRRPDQNAKQSLQHLANQTALALVLLEQRRMREDILRGERMGAALELISGIAAEVRVPLERIQSQTDEVKKQALDEHARLLTQQISNDALYAGTLLERLVSFGKSAPAQPALFDWNALVRSLIAFRSDPWRLLILEPDIGLCPQQLPVFGVRGQLEQALLGLLVHAEQSLRKAGARKIRISTEVQGKTGTLSIEFAAALEEPGLNGVDDSAMGLAVIRGILESHSGSMSLEVHNGCTFIEARLPLAAEATSPALPNAIELAVGPRRSMTLLVCVAGEEERRRAIELAAHAGHRAVPAGSAAESIELLERLRFDVVIASSQLPDMIWTEMVDRVRGYGSAFVLLDVSQSATPPELPVLRPPFELGELEMQLNRLMV